MLFWQSPTGYWPSIVDILDVDLIRDTNLTEDDVLEWVEEIENRVRSAIPEAVLKLNATAQGLKDPDAVYEAMFGLSIEPDTDTLTTILWHCLRHKVANDIGDLKAFVTDFVMEKKRVTTAVLKGNEEFIYLFGSFGENVTRDLDRFVKEELLRHLTALIGEADLSHSC